MFGTSPELVHLAALLQLLLAYSSIWMRLFAPRFQNAAFFTLCKKIKTDVFHRSRYRTQINRPRSGMSSQLGLYTRTIGNTYMCSTCDGCDLKDYTGSYHVSVSLPHDPEGWILLDEEALKDSATCADNYVRESGEEGETSRGVWVDAHMVSATCLNE